MNIIIITSEILLDLPVVYVIDPIIDNRRWYYGSCRYNDFS